MEKNYEYWIDKEHCKYGLQVSVQSCRRCLFENLCAFEHRQEQLKEKNQTFNSNKSE